MAKFRIGASSRCYTIERCDTYYDKKKKKKIEQWKAVKWYVDPVHMAQGLRDLKAFDLINQGEDLVRAIEKSNQEILKVLSPDNEKTFIETASKFDKQMQAEE